MAEATADDPAAAFDEIVIGSSPLMLLIARDAALRGARVLLLDDGDLPGGMWKVVTLRSGAKCECACHLIEDFPMIYDYLGRVTGSRFELLDPQPDRIAPNGLATRYSTRFTVLARVVKAAVHWIVLGSRALLGPLSMERRIKLDGAKLHLLDFTRFLWPKLITGFQVAAPADGYADFCQRLTDSASEAGVTIRRGHVRRVRREGTKWQLEVEGQQTLRSDKVHCTASATLELRGGTRLEAYVPSSGVSLNTVALVPNDKIVRRTAYTLFPNDPHVLRISRIDQPVGAEVGYQLYLLQFRREEPMPVGTRSEIVASKLLKAGIINDAKDVSMAENIESQFTPIDRLRQLPEGEIMPGLFVYSSAGNLSSGVLSWLKGKKRFSLGRVQAARLGT